MRRNRYRRIAPHQDAVEGLLAFLSKQAPVWRRKQPDHSWNHFGPWRESLRAELIRLRVNGKTHELEVQPNRLLLDLLRDELRLTGTKRGCDDSSCGACTVLIDGEPQMSCLMLAVSYQDCEITTIEGVAGSEERAPKLHPLQAAFALEGGAQCGFCTPGMILTAKHLLASKPDPTEQEIKEALSGNLCRCTGYEQIVASVRRAVDLMRNRRALEVKSP